LVCGRRAKALFSFESRATTAPSSGLSTNHCIVFVPASESSCGCQNFADRDFLVVVVWTTLPWFEKKSANNGKEALAKGTS